MVSEVPQTALCATHHQPLVKYCQSCEDVICQECCSRQPHSGMLHKVDTIENSFGRRRQFVQEYIEQQVNPKREALMSHIAKIHERITEVQETSKVIAKDLAVEMRAVDGRLQEAEANRVLRIQSEVKRLGQLVNLIDDLFYSFEEAVKVPQKFLLLYSEFARQLQFVAAHAVSNQLPYDLDLPREVTNMDQRLKTQQELKDYSAFLGEVLYTIVCEYDDFLTGKKKELTANKNGKLEVLYKLEEDLLTKNCQLLKVCFYCGSPLTAKTMNSACLVNKSVKFERDGSTIQRPDLMFNGNKRHFWGEATMANRTRQQYKHYLGMNGETVYMDSLRRLKPSLAQLNRYLILNETTMHKILKVKPSETHVTRLKFIYALTHVVRLDELETELLANLLTADKGIEFGRLQKALEDREYFEKAFRTELEHEREKNSFAPKSRSKYY